MAFSVLGPLGNIIIKPMNEAEFCVEVRKNPLVEDNCINCIIHSAIASAKLKQSHVFKCPYGILELVVPVFIDGEYVMAVCGGEVSTDATRIDHIYKQEEIPPHLTESYTKLKILEKEKYEAAISLVELMVQNISDVDIIINLENKNLTPLHDERIFPAIEYIQNHYHEKISVSKLAELCCISKTYFSKLFSRIKKQSLTEYITKYRIEKAKELLIHTYFTIQHISELVGFYDHPYFHRSFKKITGKTPNEFRITIRQA